MLYKLNQAIVIGGLAYEEGAIVDTALLNEGAHKDLNACLAKKIGVPVGPHDVAEPRTTREEGSPAKKKGDKT